MATKKKAAAKGSKEKHSPLAPAVLREIERLKGTKTASKTGALIVVQTIAGPRPLSEPLRAFANGVKWKPGFDRKTTGDHPSIVTLSPCSMTDEILRGDRTPYYVIATDGYHYHYLVAVDDASSDPRVRQVTHEGSSASIDRTLSSFLSGLSIDKTPKFPADQDARDDLVSACMWGSVAKIEALLEKQVPADARDRDGVPAISWAAFGWHHAAVQRLLRGGADPNAKLPREATRPMKFDKGATPIDYAIRGKPFSDEDRARRDRSLEALIAAGAKVPSRALSKLSAPEDANGLAILKDPVKRLSTDGANG